MSLRSIGEKPLKTFDDSFRPRNRLPWIYGAANCFSGNRDNSARQSASRFLASPHRSVGPRGSVSL